jgi:predicted nucleic acid-binding protein
MPSYVLDTSALVAFLNNESSAGTVETLVPRAGSRDATIVVPFISLMEVEHQLRPREGERQALWTVGGIQSWPATFPDSDPEWRSQAASLKTTGGLSLADAWVASLALRLDAELEHKDPEYDTISGLKALRLPDSLAQERA